MTSPDETLDWLARATRAADALRGLRQRLLALHAELSAIRVACGAVEAAPAVPEGEATRPETERSPEIVEQASVELPSFVWPAGRTPN